MENNDPLALTASESKKRRREKFYVVALGIFFLLLTWFEIRLFGVSSELPFVHSVFFFGLVNFNIVILLLLSFLLFRNIVKAFAEKRETFLGKSLKSKLVLAFLGFSLVPTLLMFLVSVFYINNSFDKWFSLKIAGLLRSSIEVTSEFYSTTKKRNYHYASEIAQLLHKSPPEDMTKELSRLRLKYRLDAVEFIDPRNELRVAVAENHLQSIGIPQVKQKFLQRGVEERVEASEIESFAEGNLVRVIVPLPDEREAAVVVTTWIPLSLISRMDDIAVAYEEFRDFNPLEYPIKSIYLVILVMMTLVILLCASWVGVYLARQLSVPLEILGAATRKISRHNFEKVQVVSGSEEVNELITNFNVMTTDLERSEKEVREANTHLQETLETLDEHKRHVEVILANISTGVVAVDQNGNITRINPYGCQILKVENDQVIGRPVKEVLSKEYYRIFVELLKSMRKHRATTLQKEFRPQIAGRSVPLQMKLSVLQDDQGNDLGQVIVFDDLSVVVNAQRAAAWREVARRIAHEIKNPLTPIKLSAQRLQKKFGGQISDTAFQHATKMIVDEVDGLKHLVNEFSQFARLPEAQPVFGNLNQVIEDIAGFYKLSHKECEISLDLNPELPEMEFDPKQIKRVLTNLLDNAITATKGVEGRKITVSTHYDPLLQLAQVKVVDNGPPVDDDLIERLFEPYFSTKKSGTGLGLSIVKRIIEDHNGFIRANRLQPCGLQILLELPVVVAQSAWRFSSRSESMDVNSMSEEEVLDKKLITGRGDANITS